jgi:hypothetical protein
LCPDQLNPRFGNFFVMMLVALSLAKVLRKNETRIGIIVLQKLVMRALLHDHTTRHNCDVVGVADGGELVRNDDCCAALGDTL